MSETDRRTLLKTSGAALIGSTAVAGCLGDDDSGNGDDGDINVAIVSSDAGFGDKAFNDLALQGLEQAAEDFGAEIQQIEETDQSNYQSLQSQLAEETDPSYDLIVLVGFQHTQGLEQNAAEYPDQNWMLINDVVDEDNVAGYIWANHEMSYLAGVFAGSLTSHELKHADSETDPDGRTVGFTGGVDGPLIRAFERSYVEGVEWVDDEIEVLVGYAGSFSSPQDGRNVASSQYDDGADIVYHAAAATGQGVFQAAEEANRFAVGVDADQSVTLSEFQDVILGSAIKRINEGTYEAVEAINNDDFESVTGENVLGIDEEAVDLVVGQQFEGELPAEIEENLAAARDGISDGSIDVPCTASGCEE